MSLSRPPSLDCIKDIKDRIELLLKVGPITKDLLVSAEEASAITGWTKLTVKKYGRQGRISTVMNELTDREKSELALYFKRLPFYDVYEHTDIDTKENQKAQAYRILDAIAKLQKELADQGYNPR